MQLTLLFCAFSFLVHPLATFGMSPLFEPSAVEVSLQASRKKAIIKTIQTDDIDRFQVLLNEEVSTGLDLAKSHYLHYAAKANACKITHLLITRGIDVNLQVSNSSIRPENLQNSTALMIAAQSNNTEIITLLLNKGALLELRNSFGFTALLTAITKHSNEAAKLLIDRGAQLGLARQEGAANTSNKKSEDLTPLEAAIRSNNAEILSLVIERGANLEEQITFPESTVKVTPLIFALHLKNSQDIVKVLIQKGANVQAQATADINTTKNALILTKDTTLLMYAAAYHNAEILSLLLDRGAPLENQDSRGLTALHHAILLKNKDTARFLIDKGANKEAKYSHRSGPSGNTPLMLATKFADNEILKLLIDSGALLEAQDSVGFTALHYAARFNNPEQVKLLIESGANVNAITQLKPFKVSSSYTILSNSTPLMVAAAFNSLSALKALLLNGAILIPPPHQIQISVPALSAALINKANEAASLLIDSVTVSFFTMQMDLVNRLLVETLRVNNAEGVFLLIDKGCDINAGSPGQSMWSMIIKENREIAWMVLEKYSEKINSDTITNPIDIIAIQKIASENSPSKFQTLCKLIMKKHQELEKTTEQERLEALEACKLEYKIIEYQNKCNLINETSKEIFAAKRSLMWSDCTKALVQENRLKRKAESELPNSKLNDTIDADIKPLEADLTGLKASPHFEKMLHLEKLSQLTLEQIKEVVKIVRGSSVADKNCVFLTTEILRFFKTLILPTGPAIERPGTIHDFCVQFTYHPLVELSSKVKQEPTSAANKRLIKSLQKPTLVQYTGIKHLEDLLPPQCIPRETLTEKGTQVLDFVNPSILFTSLYPYEVHYKNMEESLIEQASKNTAGISYGVITLAHVEKMGRKKPIPGHMIAYFVNKKDVFFIDAQRLNSGPEEPITRALTDLGRFIDPESAQNPDELRTMAIPASYCPSVWYIPMEVDLLQD
jgi:ankyrin repeat protein